MVRVGQSGSIGMAVLVAVGVASGSCARSGAASPGADGSSGDLVAVTRVTDGDTIHVRLRGRDERVRFIGINTPEVGWYGGQPECFGADAARFTRSGLDGRMVRLGFDRALRDRYGRLLAYVYVGGKLFNLT